MRCLALILSLAAAPAAAQQAMTAQEIDRFLGGRTMTWVVDGRFGGVETYLGGQQVVLTSFDGRCMTGRFYQQGDEVCWLYEGESGPFCYQFRADGSGLRQMMTDTPFVAVESGPPQSC